MTKIIRNSQVYMEQDGSRIYICETVPGRKKTTRESWSMMHTTPIDADVRMRQVEVPLKIRLNARKHFAQLKKDCPPKGGA